MRWMSPWLLVVVLAVATLRCTSEPGPTEPLPTAPVPGTRTLAVRSPFGAEGAALLDMDAAAVTSVAGTGTDVHTVVEGSRLRVLLVRSVPGELSATLILPDTARTLDMRLLQVSGPSNELRPSLASYVLEVRR